MYFVVYIVDLNTTLILPSTWVRDIDDHIEKFINLSLNTAQSFLCFYTNDEEAFEENGAPKMDYPANFDLQSRTDFDGPGCFIAKLKHFKVSYGDAVKYMEKHRNIAPAIYNEARLVEMPIPVTHQEVIEEMDSHADDNGPIETDLAAESSTTPNGNASAVDPLQSEPEPEQETTNSQADEIEQKPNVSQLGLRVANNNDILNLIDEDNDVELLSFEGEVFEMTVGSKGFAKPMILMKDKRIKRENDEISGPEPYYETKEKARVYKIGDNLTEFPHGLIVKLLQWNKPPRDTDRYYDERFTRALLMALVPEDRLASSNVSDEEKQFIQALFGIRCKGDMDRMDKFEGYITKLCQEKK
ncbi:uncharacterized protein LOC129572867 [Sitodiplosis mosellana]|uniref:uncharacterized protein LOC129572867 n=1 Tax=Sitodiplosis mosellana TaxID=263140 RepID=UPI0024438E1B|nr:uncharacterized protein LOC129572867 [Sitodiplosis mosellana]XP_055308956.1 uncharacterized protein LOC129572867 [Sitodiplosis mosellana]XP_055308957.1 uncharacterized protein LOC129572867 [Sitodiplosis mosellana]